MKTGKYIVLEGGDGTGKSTQLNILIDWLQEQGINCHLIEEPGGTPMADAIRLLLKDASIERNPETNVLLFTAARAELKSVFDKLADGTWIISSRSYLSTIAYQGYGEEMNIDKIRKTTELWLPEVYLKPDLEIILSVTDTAINQQRLQQRDARATEADAFESRGQKFFNRVQQGYVELGKQGGRHLINAHRSIEEVAHNIRQLVQPLVDDSK